MVVESHHVACVCGDLMKILKKKKKINKKKKNFLSDFFSKLGKKSPKFHWKGDLEKTEKIPDKANDT